MYRLKYLVILGMLTGGYAKRAMGKTNPPFMSGVPELLLLRMLKGQEMDDELDEMFW